MERVLVIAVTTLTVSWLLSAASFADTAEQNLAGWSLFIVNVEGRSSIPGAQKIREQGRAFAVDKDVLLTARHVTGNRTQWANKGDGLLYIPDRRVQIQAAKAYVRPVTIPPPVSDLFVTPAATETIDAVKLTVPNLKAREFRLNSCEIPAGAPHKALILRNGDLGKPEFIPLRPDQYSSTEFGEVLVFFTEDGAAARIQKGDSGSPVLNAQNEVIGLVSGITGDPVGSQVLVTLVRSFLELVPSSKDIVCDPRVTRDEVDKLVKKAVDEKVVPLREKLEEAATRASLALGLIRHNYDIPPEEIKQLLNQLKKDETIQARIKGMIDDLGSEDWQLRHKPGPGVDTIIEMSYRRQLSLKIFSPRTYMCIIALIAIGEGDRELKPNEVKYYQQVEKRFKLRQCPYTDHRGSEGSTKEGFYNFAITGVNKKGDLTDLEDWNKFYYLRFGYFQRNNKEIILKRYLLKIDDEGNVTSCNLFHSPRDIANFVDDQTKYKEVAHQCSS